MSAPNLETLPEEVARQIAETLPGAAIKSLRLTSQHLRRIATPRLYPVLYISCHPLDIHVFKTVNANPEIIGNVRELVIDDTTIAPSIVDPHEYNELAAHEAKFWPLRRAPYFSEESFDTLSKDNRQDGQGLALLQSIYDEHHSNRLAAADITLLNEAVPKMTRLRSLVITNRTADEAPQSGAQSLGNSSPTVRMWRSIGRRRGERLPFPPRCDWFSGWMSRFDNPDSRFEMDWLNDELGRMTRGLRECLGPNQSVDDENIEKTYLDSASTRCISREARGLLVAFEVFKHANIQAQLSEFRIDPSRDVLVDRHQPDYYQPGLSYGLFNRSSLPFSGQLTTHLQSCPNLRKFQLSVSNGYTEDKGREVVQSGAITQILGALPNLKDLSLELHWMPMWLALRDDLYFPQLRTLELSCGDIWPLKLLEFLTRHKETLETVYVRHCDISHDAVNPEWLDDDVEGAGDGPGRKREVGSWEDVVQGLTELKMAEGSRLSTIVLDTVYAFRPWNGCGHQGTVEVSPLDAGKVYSWKYGVHATLQPHGVDMVRRVRRRGVVTPVTGA